MIRVKKESIRYKIVASIFPRPSQSLCVFFWQIPIVLTIWLAMIIAGMVVLFGLIHILISPVLLLLQVSGIMMFEERELAEVVLGTFLFSIISFAGIMSVILKKFTKSEKKEPGMFISYIKAKKEKICPRIDFVDSDNNKKGE